MCRNDSIRINEKYFCCNGCKTVYEILNSNDLCDYYDLHASPGESRRNDIKRNFDFLDDPELKTKLLDFTDGTISRITFNIPRIHCSSCIWILEQLYKLDGGILNSQVDFLKKNVTVKYSEELTSLKEVVLLLDSIGYMPDLNLADKETDKEKQEIKKLYYRIGVAGFCFGNIMLLSFPEYLSFQDSVTQDIKFIFNFIIAALSLPVLLYSASPYYISAWKGIRKKIVNIDVPITLGISVLFLRSAYELLTGTGPGYLDSLSALVFFLLIGKLFQNKTYSALNFERNYKSYFPISVTTIRDGAETTIPVDKLNTGRRIIVKNNELIPADSILISEIANIDYSFVTGESTPVTKNNGDMIYAGGRQAGSAIELETIKEVSQSYLTQLWNTKSFSKHYHSNLNSLVNIISRYFTFIVLFIASLSFIYWSQTDINTAFSTFTAVLIIACPCALALSTPFTLGNTQRIFGRNKFYVKNSEVIERMAAVTSIVFDKTGTLTEPGSVEVEFAGIPLTDKESAQICAVARNSMHPISREIYDFTKGGDLPGVEEFEEITGEGIRGKVDGNTIKLGAAHLVNRNTEHESSELYTKAHLSVNDSYRGCFNFKNKYRHGLDKIIKSLPGDVKLSVITGDNNSEEDNLRKYFGGKADLKFLQSPFDKLEYVKQLQEKDEVVLMLGDGLNDAGALKSSDVGISVSEDINNFTPASDGILEASSFGLLGDFIRFSQISRKIIILSFIVSFLYNIIGFGFAVQGLLSPVVAAILMPLSSISVVILTTFMTNYFARLKGLLSWK